MTEFGLMFYLYLFPVLFFYISRRLFFKKKNILMAIQNYSILPYSCNTQNVLFTLLNSSNLYTIVYVYNYLTHSHNNVHYNTTAYTIKNY